MSSKQKLRLILGAQRRKDESCRHRRGILQPGDTWGKVLGNLLGLSFHTDSSRLSRAASSKHCAAPSHVCEVSEERKEKETGPFLPDKMMQVLVKGGGGGGEGGARLGCTRRLWYVHTHAHRQTYSVTQFRLVKALHRVLMNLLHTQTHSALTPPLFVRHFKQ